MGTVALQHRGEEGCGISFDRRDGFYTDTSKQLAFYFFRDKTNGLDGLRQLAPTSAIGHTLYERSGGLQPVEQWGVSHLVSLAMDGVLLGFRGKTDSVMSTLFSRYIDETDDFYEAGNRVMETLDGRGSYCVASLVKNSRGTSLVAFRDPRGIKPYCLGRKGEKFIVASESKAIDGIEGDFLKDIEPGEMIVVSKKGLESKVLVKQQHAHCFFEWIYFADPTSVVEGKNVYEFRKQMGRRVADRYADKIDVDLVMASPDSGRGVAIGFQQRLSELYGRMIPYEESAVKNPGSKRTFQVEDEEQRKLAARVKFFINEGVVGGRNIAVGDDSIVRGTVFRDGMIYKLRKAGAGKIYAVISCPALLHACIKDPRGASFIARGLDGAVGEQVAGLLSYDGRCC